MRPEFHDQMWRALVLGPNHCAPDLFSGTVPAIVSGLRMHSATIGKARHTALEQVFPRTRRLIGVAGFRELAEEYLARADVASLTLNDLGRCFPDLLRGEAQFLASMEWAWLEAYGAADAPALKFTHLALLNPGSIVDLKVVRHPAARLVIGPGKAAPVKFDGATVSGPAVLLTRPDSEVIVTGSCQAAAALLPLLDSPIALGPLLERAPGGVALLLKAGALTPASGPDR